MVFKMGSVQAISLAVNVGWATHGIFQPMLLVIRRKPIATNRATGWKGAIT